MTCNALHRTPDLARHQQWELMGVGYPGGESQRGDVALTDQCATQVPIPPMGGGGGHWYRFSGDGGDALPRQRPGVNHCGSASTGWLSGWDASGAPPHDFSQEGIYPSVADGVVERTACIDLDSNDPCGFHVGVGVVQCVGFFLWRLSVGTFNSGCSAVYALLQPTRCTQRSWYVSRVGPLHHGWLALTTNSVTTKD
jgi:hypothetical protein